MIVDVRLRPEAEQDLADAATWYEGTRPGLGEQFLEEMRSVISSIAERHATGCNMVRHPN